MKGFENEISSLKTIDPHFFTHHTAAALAQWAQLGFFLACSALVRSSCCLSSTYAMMGDN